MAGAQSILRMTLSLAALSCSAALLAENVVGRGVRVGENINAFRSLPEEGSTYTPLSQADIIQVKKFWSEVLSARQSGASTVQGFPAITMAKGEFPNAAAGSPGAVRDVKMPISMASNNLQLCAFGEPESLGSDQGNIYVLIRLTCHDVPPPYLRMFVGMTLKNGIVTDVAINAGDLSPIVKIRRQPEQAN